MSEKSLLATLRALVISSKGGLPARKLYADFREIGGADSQFKDLGFATLDAFVQAHPEELRVSNGLISAAEKAQSSHIVKLIRQQHSKKKPRLAVSRRPGGYSRSSLGRPAPVRRPNPGYAPPPRFTAARQNEPPRYARYDPPPPRSDPPPVQMKPESPILQPRNVRPHRPRSPAPQPGPFRTQPSSKDRIRAPRNFSNNLVAAAMAELVKERNAEDFEVSRRREAIIEQAVFMQDTMQDWITLTGSEGVERRNVEKKTVYAGISGQINGGRIDAREPSWVREVTLQDTEKKERSGDHNKENTRRNNANEAFTEFRAKELPSRKLYRHRSEEEPTREYYNGGGGESSRVVYYSPHTVKDSRQTTGAFYNDIAIEDCIPTPSAPLPVLEPLMSLGSKNKAAQRLQRIQADLKTDVSAPLPVDLVERLKVICKNKGVEEPEYETCRIKDGGVPIYFCILKVGEAVFKSSAFKQDSQAKEDAAKKALEVLGVDLPEVSNKENLRQQVVNDIAQLKIAEQSLEQSVQPPTSEQVFLNNLKKICSQKFLWYDSVPETYLDQFRCAVPSNWCSLVDSCPFFTTSDSLGKKLLQLVRDPVGASQSVSTPGLAITPELENDAELETASNETDVSDVLPALQLPEDSYWDLYVMYTESHGPHQLWCRLIGKEYSEKFDNMISALEVEMLEAKDPVIDFRVGELYALKAEDSWHRVQLECILEEQFLVYQLDDGEITTARSEDLFPLAPQYRELAPQAFKVVLDGLENFPDLPIMHQLMLDYVFSAIRVAKVVNNDPNEELDVEARVVLWDTSTEDDININLLLMTKVVESLEPPELKLGSSTREMRLSHAVPDGAYLQNCGSDVACMECLVEYLTRPDTDLSQFTVLSTNLNLTKIYLARDPISETFKRAQVVSIVASDVSVLFVDYGTEATVPVTDLLKAELLCKVLSQVPPLAVKVSLSGVEELNDETTEFLRTCVAEDSMMVKLIDANKMAVELWRRSGASYQLMNINEQLLKYKGKSIKAEEAVSDEMETLDLELPAVGDLFNVTITMAASPYVFTVQPADMGSQISELMMKLQETCTDSTDMLKITQLSVGRLVAVLYSDGNWFRAKVKAVIGREAVSVELCDFGNLYIVSVDHIRVLPAELRILPCLAIRARLHGVVPVNGDWTPDDCVFFQERVLQTDLASQVKEITTNDSGESVLHLELIDTSSENDIYISQLLILNGMATAS